MTEYRTSLVAPEHYHRECCQIVHARDTLQDRTVTLDEAAEMGLDPCNHCDPPNHRLFKT